MPTLDWLDREAAMAKEIEKAQVGKLWADSSAGRCLFAFVYRHEGGMNMSQQLDAILT